ncbi:MAG: c-type cytochrome [bacterium]
MRLPFLIIAYMLIVVTVYSQQKADGIQVGKNVERGRYIAENVAMCIQCHTPREASGELIRSQAFHGAPVPVGRPVVISSWAEYAPRIAGLPQYTTEQAIILLTSGIARDGKALRSPMPTFKMTREDAEAVASYLKSVD